MAEFPVVMPVPGRVALVVPNLVPDPPLMAVPPALGLAGVVFGGESGDWDGHGPADKLPLLYSAAIVALGTPVAEAVMSPATTSVTNGFLIPIYPP